MSKVLSVKEVNELLKNRRTGVKKPILFEKEILGLKTGEGFEITTKEWSLKTSPSSYYYQKFNKREDVKLSILKTENGVLVVRK